MDTQFSWGEEMMLSVFIMNELDKWETVMQTVATKIFSFPFLKAQCSEHFPILSYYFPATREELSICKAWAIFK